MQISLHNSPIASCKQGLLVLGVHADGLAAAHVVEADRACHGALRRAARAQRFSGQAGQQLLFQAPDGLVCQHVALVGMGSDSAGQGVQPWLRLGGAATRIAMKLGAADVRVVGPPDGGVAEPVAHAATVCRGAVLGGYAFTKYHNRASPRPVLPHVVLHLPNRAEARHDVASAQCLAEGVALCRDLVNEPPNVLFPASFATRATQWARRAKLGIKVFAPPALRRMRMNLLLAVGQGSVRVPRLVHLVYPGTAAGRGQAPVALVGKGITFDSGGLCMKGCDAMGTMKMDMAGAATVLATVVTAARLKLPTPVHGVLALAENMPSGTSFRCGDVLVSAAGKSVEINNTDAEGRLVLADALHYAQKSCRPRCIIDLATLTGACIVALGPQTAGLFANDEPLAAALQAAAVRAGEDVWRMPLASGLRRQLQSHVADLRNTGERFGGAITASLFLQEFVSQTPWAHIDMAGPAWSDVEGGYMSRGGTGMGVAMLVAYLTALGGRARAQR